MDSQQHSGRVSLIRQIPFALGLILCLSFGARVQGGDWPQILGPHRNGIAVDEKLASSWPEGGPKEVWKRQVGSGFAGVAVSGNTGILYHRVDNEEFVEAFNAATGKVAWKKGFPTAFVPAIVDDDGPRAVPVIHEGRVFVTSPEGFLRCLSLKDGSLVWDHAPVKRYSAPNSYFGAGSTPVVDGEKLLVNLGDDRDGAGITAFAVETGKLLWKSTSEIESYSSPIVVTVNGVRHAIFVTRLNVVSLDPETGMERFRFRFGQRGPTVNGATPVVFGDHLFVTASYGVGAVLVKIGKKEAEILWESDDVLSSQYTTSIYLDGALYGIDGRQDLGVARLRCFDPLTRKINWTEDAFGKATLILADGKLIAMKTNGEAILASASPKKYQELARAKLLTGTTRALPALAHGRLYVRNENTLKCFDVSGK